MAYRLAGTLMIGGIIQYAKSLTNTPSLSQEYVECNGQTLSDAQSVYNGQVIPSLNTGTQRFLKGSTTSGTTAGADTHTHTSIGTGNTALSVCYTYCPKYLMSTESNLPAYYELVYIMRIK